MFLVGLLSWWYGDGWRAGIVSARARLARTSDFFSISLLLGTLFAPFRQISAGRVSGSLSDQLRAFGDQLVSRLIGAIVRLAMVLIGVVVLLVKILTSFAMLILWPVVPLLPAAGLVATLIGWVPSW